MADDKPLTTDDLYGTSNGQPSSPAASPAPTAPPPPLPVEETPEILPAPPIETPSTNPPPMAPPPPTPPPVTPAAPQKSSGCLRTIGIIILVVGIFVLGIWLSNFIRQYLPGGNGGTVSTQSPTPTENPVSTQSGTTISGTTSSWTTYQVISGITKLPISGVSFQLPASVLAPICDGTNCVSQGTYLPGGTRFTVAPRGTGQVLPDYRGTVISDVNGITFTSNPTTIAGRQAVEYTGTFTGRTVSGYAFTKMHGYMIALTDTTSLEINHFTPAGITADFDSDETLFQQIMGTLSITGTASSTIKGAVLVTPTPTITKTATSSGY